MSLDNFTLYHHASFFMLIIIFAETNEDEINPAGCFVKTTCEVDLLYIYTFTFIYHQNVFMETFIFNSFSHVELFSRFIS